MSRESVKTSGENWKECTVRLKKPISKIKEVNPGRIMCEQTVASYFVSCAGFCETLTGSQSKSARIGQLNVDVWVHYD